MSHRNPNRPIGVPALNPDESRYENSFAHGQKDYEQGYTTLTRRLRTHNGAWVEVDEARRHEKGDDMGYYSMRKGY